MQDRSTPAAESIAKVPNQGLILPSLLSLIETTPLESNLVRPSASKLPTLIAAHQSQEDAIERSAIEASILTEIRNHPDVIDSAVVPAAMSLVPCDRIASAFMSLGQGNSRLHDALFSLHLSEKDPERRSLYFRALRNLIANNRELVAAVDVQRISSLSSALLAMEVPLGHSQGFGLLTNFSAVSHAFLERLGTIRALPLPERMPTMKKVTSKGIQSDPGKHWLAKQLGLSVAVRFGRSERFSSSQVSPGENPQHHLAIKAAHSNPNSRDPGELETAHARLRYEADVMEYLKRHRGYFGLESTLPVPARGLAGRTHAWQFEGRAHLMYAAAPDYFEYLENLRDCEELREALLLNVRDLMRLAKHGIFHTEIAPIFHNRKLTRRYLWNVEGLLVGAGRLSAWEESFQYSNMRKSGIADLEHIERFAALPAVVPLVNDTEPLSQLGFQYHLGNILFCALHNAGLWYRRHDAFDVQRTALEALIKDVFNQAFEAFCGSPWQQMDQDISPGSIAIEMSRFMGCREVPLGSGISQDLGAGVYPAQELIKGITAFTIRALSSFAANHAALRAALPSRIEETTPEFRQLLPLAKGSGDPGEILSQCKGTAVVGALAKAGVPLEAIDQIVYHLKFGALGILKIGSDEKPQKFLAIQACGVLAAMERVFTKRIATSLAKSVLVPDPRTEFRERTSLYALALSPEGWCV